MENCLYERTYAEVLSRRLTQNVFIVPLTSNEPQRLEVSFIRPYKVEEKYLLVELIYLIFSGVTNPTSHKGCCVGWVRNGRRGCVSQSRA